MLKKRETLSGKFIVALFILLRILYIYIYIYSEMSLQGDREEYITQENDGK